MKNLTVSQLQPMAGYVLIEPAQAETKTASGIILPESDSEKPQYGTVLAVGEGECDDCECGCGGCGCGWEEEHGKGEKTHSHSHDQCDGEPPVKVGDQVIYKKWGGNEVLIDDVEYQFLKFEDILAIIGNKK
ncbi:MAG: 10 kDa chaperonin [Candidatus Pacebacteria bacterium GW2011_GWA1_46_10]|nr:MAG: 10 kDa chaperonin [Candidatus Pacebacteria bacterium GW2011_GWA1_46_10]HCR81739.1 co-chaperone GroES [Candidatus Paceibacterota bacterium]